MRRMPDAWVSVSATTRKPRAGERDGVDYFFLDDADFDLLVSRGGLLEWAEVHDARYGTPKETVEEHIAAGKQVILEIDVQGAFQVKEKMPHAQLIFIEPPSLEELTCRLRRRGTESQAKIEARLEVAKVELSQKMEYDIRLINDDLDKAEAELVAFVNEKANQE